MINSFEKQVIPASAFNGGNVLTPIQTTNIQQTHQQQAPQANQQQGQTHQNAQQQQQINAQHNQQVNSYHSLFTKNVILSASESLLSAQPRFFQKNN